MRALLSPNSSRLGLGFQQRWRLLSSTAFHVASKSFDVAPQRRVLSVNSSPVALTGLGRDLCTGIMGGHGCSETMGILLDRRSTILARRIFLWCCPLQLVDANKVDWQRKEVQGEVDHCFVLFSSVGTLQVAIKSGWRRRPPKCWIYCLVPRSFANNVWTRALFGLGFGHGFVYFRVYLVATHSLRRKGKKKL